MIELPNGWMWARISDVTERVPNFKPELHPEREFGYIDISSIDNSSFHINITEVRRFQGKHAPSRARRPIQPRDILFSNVRTYLRNVAIVPENLAAELCSTGFSVLRPNPAIEPRYLFRYVLGDEFIDRVTPQQTGTHYPATSDRVVMAERIALPPLAEQRRIVAKLDTLLNKVNSCQYRLAKIPFLLERFRQSVLAAACSGRLTADWRESVDGDDLESAEDPNPTALSPVEEIFETPDYWRWLPLDALCDPARAICYGVIKLGAECPEGIPCLRTSDVKPLRIDTAEVKRIAPEISNQYRRTLLRGGEVLVNVRGTLGGVAVVTEDLRNWNISREVALVPVAGVVSKFVAFWIASLPAQNWLTGVVKGVAYTGINIEDLRLLPIALPSLAEQQEIVCRVEELFALAERIETRFASAKARVERMPSSFLAKAFSGELVPTEAELAENEGRDFESAEQLLGRVKK